MDIEQEQATCHDNMRRRKKSPFSLFPLLRPSMSQHGHLIGLSTAATASLHLTIAAAAPSRPGNLGLFNR